MSGIFKVKKITNLDFIKENEEIPESDFSILAPNNKFVQFEYFTEDALSTQDVKIKPGIYTIAFENMRMVLKTTTFTPQPVLEESVGTKEITDKINTFFSKIDVYRKYKLDPKRALLLYGPPGTGKSLTISKICEDYSRDASTAVLLWPSDKFEARDVKAFLKSFNYQEHNVSKFILVIEDLGGVENADGGRRYSESSLLSMLDNVEQTFKIPTMILATTNYPEKFLENLTDRPQRFDDVIEVCPPSGEFRSKFIEFFSQGEASDSAKEKIKDKKYDGFSVAHVKEVVIRSAIYDITLEEAMDQLHAQSAKVKKGFTKIKGSMGIGST